MTEVKIEVALSAAGPVEELLAEREDGRWMVLEDKPSGRAWIAGYFEARADGETALRALLPVLDPEWLAAEAEWREMGDADWRDSYKVHFKAWQFGRLHWVPVWERDSYVVPAGHAVLWLDPGLAFGTGNHETTRLCCERLATWAEARAGGGLRAERERDGGQNDGATEAGATDRSTGKLTELRVLDAGCGSGILALSAAKLGIALVAGFDNDPEAVRVARENAELNGLAGVVPFFTGDLVSGLAGRQAELVLANIQADVLIAYAKELVAAVAPGGELVLSGILAGENAAVQATFVAYAATWQIESRVLGEWSDVRLVRPA